MKSFVREGKSIFIYYDGSIRIHANGVHLYLDRKDMELIYDIELKYKEMIKQPNGTSAE